MVNIQMHTQAEIGREDACDGSGDGNEAGGLEDRNTDHHHSPQEMSIQERNPIILLHFVTALRSSISINRLDSSPALGDHDSSIVTLIVIYYNASHPFRKFAFGVSLDGNVDGCV